MESFCKDVREKGYVVIPGFFSREEMSQLESLHEETLTFPNTQIGRVPNSKIHPDAFNYNLKLAKFILGSEKVKNVFKDVIGEKPTYMHHSDCHQNWSGGYHRDSIDKPAYLGFEPNFLYSEHANDNFGIYKMAIYLTESESEVFRVLEGSHNKPGSRERFLENEVKIKASLGDVVVFDTRIYHRGVLNKEVSNDLNRRAIFFTLGKNNEYSRNFSNGTVWRQNKTLKVDEYSLNTELKNFLIDNEYSIVKIDENFSLDAKPLLEEYSRLSWKVGQQEEIITELRRRIKKDKGPLGFYKKLKLLYVFKFLKRQYFRCLKLMWFTLIFLRRFLPTSNTIIVISDGAGCKKTGGAKPIDNYLNFLEENNSKLNFKYLPMDKIKRPQAVWSLIFSNKIIINGLKSMSDDRTFFFNISKLSDKIYLYLHETNWVFRKVELQFPDLYPKMVELISRSNILCVSKLQEDFLKSKFGNVKTHVIYNNIEDDKINQLENFETSSRKSSTKRIVMVGSVQERKGVNFFSQVADTFTDDPNYEFYWVGRKMQRDLYYSKNVIWKDALYGDDLIEFLKNSDLFFLSSYDDPFPLVVLEAIALGLHVIASKDVGSSELLEELDGCAVFENFDPLEVKGLIQKVLGSEIDLQKYHNIVQDFCRISSFDKRLRRALEI